MPAPFNVIPWGLHPLKPWIKTELLKRSNEIGMNTDSANYSGPKTAWMRFFSNGTGVQLNLANTAEPVKREGFVMGGVHGFDDSYGFNADGNVTIGYDANGKPHTISADTNTTFPHRPPPSIESIDVSLYGGQNASFSGLCRRTKVNWKCYSLDQLNYLAPYFLSPKVTIVLEWGWNNYNIGSLIDLANKQEVISAMLDGGTIMKRIEDSNGNYDASVGFTFDYSFTMNPLGGWDCYTEFVNANWLIEGKEYKNTSLPKTITDKKTGKKTETPLKTYIEFVDKDLNNLGVKDKESKDNLHNFNLTNKSFSVSSKPSKIQGSAGHSEQKTWIRMDLVQQIFNIYFETVFKDGNGKSIGKGGVLDITDTIICGHPGIKSVNEEILIPNKFAPRFTTEKSEDEKNRGTIKTTLENAKIGSGPNAEPYYKLFKNTGIEKVIKSDNPNKLTDEYDDLQEIINPGGNSFPMYEMGGPPGIKNSYPGTWGYLRDIFVSTKLIKDVTSNNDTAYRMLQSLLDIISDAFSGVVQLKVYIPDPYNSKLSVMDTNYNPHAFPDSVVNLVRFTPGSVNSAFMTSVGLNVKLSPEMANQMVAQSSAGKNVDGVQVRTGVQKANRFVGNDRLYELGTLDINVASDTSIENTKPVSPRDLSVNNFYVYQNGTGGLGNGKLYILAERDRTYMQSIVANDTSGKTTYINSPMMAGTKFTMTTQGIGGFTFLGQFTLDHVPEPYAYKNCVWQIADIKQKITLGNWITEITADCRPLSYLE